MFSFIRNWTLPIAMTIGGLLYLLFSQVEFFAPYRHSIHIFSAFLAPVLVFLQLLVTFCKISFHELLPQRFHFTLILVQFFSTLLFSLPVILYPDLSDTARYILEGAVILFICPTATAAAVITGKLGGSAAALTTYTLFSNLLAALVVPILFPLLNPSVDTTFLQACRPILHKTILLLILPFFVAVFLRRYLPRISTFLATIPDLAFYLWALCLTCVIGMACHASYTSTASLSSQIAIAVTALVVCALLFPLGKFIGSHYHQRISCGQALGQKNTTLALWLAYTYLSPIAALGPGAYIIWQNIVNSFQLYLKRKNRLKTD
ncbi:MAG: transporter [Paludibacteraceae bacterium]|nr:transporter [Paludibacteraceae bacterium]